MLILGGRTKSLGHSQSLCLETEVTGMKTTGILTSLHFCSIRNEMKTQVLYLLWSEAAASQVLAAVSPCSGLAGVLYTCCRLLNVPACALIHHKQD